MDIMIAVAVGVFLLVAWTVGGWAIVRMGFTRDGTRPAPPPTTHTTTAPRVRCTPARPRTRPPTPT